MPLDLNCLRELCASSHQIAKEKGWLDVPRSWAGTTRLLESELAEALEDYRKHRGLRELYYELQMPDGTTAALASLGGLPDEVRATAKPCGIPIELADFIIRIAQHCGTENWDLAAAIERLNPYPIAEDLEGVLADVGVCVSLAYATSATSCGLLVSGMAIMEMPVVPLVYLATATGILFGFCDREAIDLWEAIQIKQEYNRTRSYRHGNKKI